MDSQGRFTRVTDELECSSRLAEYAFNVTTMYDDANFYHVLLVPRLFSVGLIILH
jgi:hypothetical protein